jgi:Phage integrase family
VLRQFGIVASNLLDEALAVLAADEHFEGVAERERRGEPSRRPGAKPALGAALDQPQRRGTGSKESGQRARHRDDSDALRALRDLRLASRFKQADDFVFASTRGTPLEGRNVSRMFGETLKRARLPQIRFHDLRNTFASLLIANGAHVKFISEQLGHASSQITLDRYGHLLGVTVDELAEAITHLAFYAGWPCAVTAMTTLRGIVESQ